MEIMLTANTVTGVRIPLSPPEKAEPVEIGGLFACLLFSFSICRQGKVICPAPKRAAASAGQKLVSWNRSAAERFSRHLNHEFAGESREWGRRSILFLDFIQVLLYFLLIAARIYSILLVTISASREGRKERESGRGNWDTLAAESLLTEGTFLFWPPFGGADSFCPQMGRQKGLECGRIPQVFRE